MRAARADDGRDGNSGNSGWGGSCGNGGVAPDSLTRQLPTTPKGDKPEKDGRRCEPHAR